MSVFDSVNNGCGEKMFIQTETQQDENLMKFLPGREVLSSGMVRFMDRAQAAGSPLAKRLKTLGILNCTPSFLNQVSATSFWPQPPKHKNTKIIKKALIN